MRFVLWMLNHETYIFNVETASTACWMRSLTMAATRDCLPPLILGKQAPPSSQCAPVLPSGFGKTGNQLQKNLSFATRILPPRSSANFSESGIDSLTVLVSSAADSV